MKIFFVLNSLFFLSYINSVFAHVEPALTLTQKIQHSFERFRYKNAQIKEVETFEVDLKDTTKTHLKRKVVYDYEGNVIEQLQFSKDQKLHSMVLLEYDNHNEMIKQSNFDSTNQRLGYAVYEYDKGGRIQSYQEFSPNDLLVATFTYGRIPEKSQIILTKLNTMSERVYSITYVLVDGIDGFVKTIQKKVDHNDGNEQVTYEYNSTGEVSKKSVYKNQELLWQWLYDYDENNNPIALTKEFPNGSIESTIETRYNEQHLPTYSVQSVEGKVIQKLVYRYTTYQTKH